MCCRGWFLKRRVMLPCLLATIAVLSAGTISAAERKAEKASEKRIYRTDSMGRVQYHKPSYTVRSDGRIIETDQFGNRQYHKPQYQIKDGKVYQTGSSGNIQYHKSR